MNGTLETDVCDARHQGNAASIDANPDSSDKQRDRELVLKIINNSLGVTSKEIAEQMGKSLNCISGRISELKRSDLIEVFGRRDKCGINFIK